MATEVKAGFLVTQGRIALALSFITLMTLGYQGSKAILDVHYRLASLEEKWVSMEGTQRDVANELRNLNTSLNQLNLVLREVQVKQQEIGK
jgi:hypothetical protein